MDKGTKTIISFIGLGLIYFSFRSKNSVTKTEVETAVNEVLNVLDKNLAFSTKQVQTLARQIKESGGSAVSHIQIRTWKGLVQLDIEEQIKEKRELTISMMNQLSTDLDNAFARIINGVSSSALTNYCTNKGFEVSDRIYTIEQNLINLSKLL